MTEFLISFFTAALSGMGVGGGGLLLIYLTLFRDTAQKEAQLINLVFFLAASSASLVFHVTKRKISPMTVALLSSGGVIGAVIGAGLASFFDGGALRMILGGFLFVSGALSLFGGEKRGKRKSGYKKGGVRGKYVV